MKRRSLYFCFLILPFFSHAQFDYSFDFISSIDFTDPPNGVFLASEDLRTNFRVGFNFNTRVVDNLFIKTGLRYVEMGYTDKLDDLRWPSEIGPNGFMEDPTLPRYLHSTIDQQLLEIPLMLRYEIGKSKIGYFFELGISPHLYFKTRTRTTSNLGTETTSAIIGRDRLKVAYVFGVGVNYKLPSLFQLFIQPTFRSYPADSASFSGVARRSFGVEFGVRRGFVSNKSKVK